MRWLFGLILTLAMAFPAAAADRAIIILDGSGSMWAQIDGEARISIARETLEQVLGVVPEDLELGFMTYGHREKGSCDDIQVLVEPGKGTGPAISEAAKAINPKGKTPISAAVKLAAEDLRYTEDKATVILITDGIETCEADPCALASELEASGIDFTTHVVGFGLTDEEGKQVACLAENTGGQYFQASDGDALGKALATTVAQVAEPAPAPEPTPEPAAPEFNFDPQFVMYEGADEPSGDEVSPTWEVNRANPDGTIGAYVSNDYGVGYKGFLEPGDYFVSVWVDYAKVTMPVTIEAGKVAEPLFTLNAGRLTIRPFAADGEPVNEGAAVYFEFPDGNSTTNYGETAYYVPAGDNRVTVTIGKGEAIETIAVAAGAEVSKDMIVGVGRVTLNGLYAEGMVIEDGGVTFNIVGAKKDIQGNRDDFGTAYGPNTAFDLPPGDYVARVSMDEAAVEAPFTLKSGDAIAVDALLNAGVLYAKAMGADGIDIFSAKKDIQGNATQFGYAYGEERNATVPAGEYRVVARMKDGTTKETAATVTPGERTELALE